MASVAETLINDYMSRKASESKQETMDTLSGLGSTAAPTNYTMNANSFIGGFNQGMSNLIKFAQTGDRKRAEAAEQARLDEATAAAREQQAFDNALATRASDLAQADFDFRKGRALKADQKDEALKLKTANTAKFLQEGYIITDQINKEREVLGNLNPVAEELALLKGTEDGTGVVLDTATPVDELWKTYSTHTKGKGLSQEEYVARVNKVRGDYGTSMDKLHSYETGLQTLQTQYRDKLVLGQSTVDTSDDIGSVDFTQFGKGQGMTATQKTRLAEELAAEDRALEQQLTDIGYTADLQGVNDSLYAFVKNGTKPEDRVGFAIKDLTAEQQEEVRTEAGDAFAALQGTDEAKGMSIDELWWAATQGSIDSIGTGKRYSIDSTGDIDEDDALKMAKLHLTRRQRAKDTEAEKKAATDHTKLRKGLITGKYNLQHHAGSILK